MIQPHYHKLLLRGHLHVYVTCHQHIADMQM